MEVLERPRAGPRIIDFPGSPLAPACGTIEDQASQAGLPSASVRRRPAPALAGLVLVPRRVVPGTATAVAACGAQTGLATIECHHGLDAVRP